jgi:hypothetical protein
VLSVRKFPFLELSPYASAAAALDNCQKNIFNAGDDYVGLVMNFIGAEDDALKQQMVRHPHR